MHPDREERLDRRLLLSVVSDPKDGTGGGESMLSKEKELKGIPGFLLLTGCFAFRECLCHRHLPCDCTIFFLSSIFGALYCSFVPYHLKGQTPFERIANESIKLRKDVLRPRSALACTHLWSSLWMEFCAYSSPNLALRGYIMYSSVSVESL